MITVKGKTNVYVFADEIDSATYNQLIQMGNHPALDKYKAVMPDCHAGAANAVIGFTMPLDGNDLKVIPQTIGVDIGCGVLGVNFGKIELPKFKELDDEIRKAIPFGDKFHQKPVFNPENFSFGADEFYRTCEKIGCKTDRAIGSVGSVGGGNHFIEIAKSQKTGEVWVNIHTGSRNFGALICDYWQKHAKKALQIKRDQEFQSKMEELKVNYSGEELGDKISEFKRNFKLDVDVKGAEWLTGADARGYLDDMKKAQEYAEENRMQIAKIIERILGVNMVEAIESVHNFIDFYDEDYPMIRKGAIRAHYNSQVIIPISPSYGTIIGIGHGNPDWNYSAPHGAGRRMGRNEAKKKLDVDNFEKAMEGIFSTNVNKKTLDESPECYKNPTKIIEQMLETVIVKDTLKPIHCIKEKG